MTDLFVKNICEINLDDIISSNSVVAGIDVGEKTVGIAISDRRIRIASGVISLTRKGDSSDYKAIADLFRKYKIWLVIFGWPLQMNGSPSNQCSKILKFVMELSKYVEVCFAKWDERFSTKVVERIMIEANLSRSKRKKNIDKNAATYILQGAIDFLNKK